MLCTNYGCFLFFFFFFFDPLAFKFHTTASYKLWIFFFCFVAVALIFIQHSIKLNPCLFIRTYEICSLISVKDFFPTCVYHIDLLFELKHKSGVSEDLGLETKYGRHGTILFSRLVHARYMYILYLNCINTGELYCALSIIHVSHSDFLFADPFT